MAQTHNESEDSSGNELSQALDDLVVEEKVSTGVLKISDDNEKFHYKSPLPLTQKWFFHNDFKARLQFLTLGKTPPLPFGSEENMEHFQVTCCVNHQLRCRYIHFHIFTHAERTIWTSKYGFGLISGPTLSARRVMLTVKSHYRNEKWLKNSNTMELPLKSKLDDFVVQTFVSKCLNDETTRLYNFIKFLETQTKFTRKIN